MSKKNMIFVVLTLGLLFTACDENDLSDEMVLGENLLILDEDYASSCVSDNLSGTSLSVELSIFDGGYRREGVVTEYADSNCTSQPVDDVMRSADVGYQFVELAPDISVMSARTIYGPYAGVDSFVAYWADHQRGRVYISAPRVIEPDEQILAEDFAAFIEDPVFNAEMVLYDRRAQEEL